MILSSCHDFSRVSRTQFERELSDRIQFAENHDRDTGPLDRLQRSVEGCEGQDAGAILQEMKRKSTKTRTGLVTGLTVSLGVALVSMLSRGLAPKLTTFTTAAGVLGAVGCALGQVHHDVTESQVRSEFLITANAAATRES